MSQRIPFLARAAPLYGLVYLTLFSWWWTMSLLFQGGFVVDGVAMAYFLPAVVSLTALLAASLGSEKRWVNLAHLWVLLPLALFFLALAAGPLSQDLRWVVMVPQADQPTGAFHPKPTVAAGSVLSDPSPLVGIGLISAVVTLMLYPLAGAGTYHKLYRRPLFVSGVVFMPFFIALAALFRAPVRSIMGGNEPLTLELKLAGLLAIFAGFWLSGTWLASRRTQGEHVPGPTAPFRPRFLMGERAIFRPDLILPGGVTIVKGVVLMGAGLLLAIHDHLSLPRFNWWGFGVAFFGIIALIPARGMWKMFRGRGPRMVGDRGTLWGRELLLFFGLLLLLYGFVNAFKGFTPFQVLGATPRYLAPPAPSGLAAALLALSFAVLVVLRGWLKTRLPEGGESFRQFLGKHLLLYLGVLLMILGLIHLFHLPADAVTPDNPNKEFIGFYPANYPMKGHLAFAAGIALHLLGALLILGFRPLALRNEFRATMRIMPGAIADMAEGKRRVILEKRMRTLAAMDERQRNEHVRWMMLGVNALPPEKRTALVGTQMEVLSGLSSEERTKMMAAMDAAMTGAA